MNLRKKSIGEHTGKIREEELGVDFTKTLHSYIWNSETTKDILKRENGSKISKSHMNFEFGFKTLF